MSNLIREQLKRAAADLFQCNAEDVQLDMKPGDIRLWDSLGHITLLEMVQEKFNVEISLEDALGAESLEDIAVLLETSIEKSS